MIFNNIHNHLVAEHKLPSESNKQRRLDLTSCTNLRSVCGTIFRPTLQLQIQKEWGQMDVLKSYRCLQDYTEGFGCVSSTVLKIIFIQNRVLLEER